MHEDGKYRIGNDDIELLGKIDKIFQREKDLLFFKEIASKQINSSLKKSFAFRNKLKIGISSILALIVMGFFAYIISNDNKIDDTTTLNDIIFTENSTETADENISIDSTMADAINQNIDKSTERLIKPDPRAKRVRIEKQDGNIAEELNSSEVLANEAQKLQNVKIVDGYQIANRETVISTSVALKNSGSISILQSKLAQIFQKLNLDYIAVNSDNAILNLTSKKYAGELKNSEKALFSIQFKISNENNSKLQLILRYNKIESIIDGNQNNFKNIDKIYYNQLKQEILNNLKEYLN